MSVQECFRVIAAIVSLGNVQFEQDGEGSRVADREEVSAFSSHPLSLLY